MDHIRKGRMTGLRGDASHPLSQAPHGVQDLPRETGRLHQGRAGSGGVSQCTKGVQDMNYSDIMEKGAGDESSRARAGDHEHRHRP
jgi:hypothetical protein